jgi:putative membrane protein
MRIVTWAIRLVLFVLLVALAAKNLETVTLRFYFERTLQAPLIVLLLAAFALGALFGMLALLASVLRQRRELALLKKKNFPSEAPPPAPPF